MKKKILIFTDLDGTLLDYHTYSYKPALVSLSKIKKKNIPLIICTSKTRAEIGVYQSKLRSFHPFISENGGAIFIPKGYFEAISKGLKKINGYLVKELGTPYQNLRKKLVMITARFNQRVKGFGDMAIKEIHKKYGLSLKEASLSKKREYDEPFYFVKPPNEKILKRIEKEFARIGLNMLKGGRLFHLTGKNDKGKAVRILTKIYEKKCKRKVTSIGLGDSLNDLAMLLEVDYPVLVQLYNGRYEERVLEKLKNPFLSKGIGPRGWNQAVLQILKEIENEE